MTRWADLPNKFVNFSLTNLVRSDHDGFVMVWTSQRPSDETTATTVAAPAWWKSLSFFRNSSTRRLSHEGGRRRNLATRFHSSTFPPDERTVSWPRPCCRAKKSRVASSYRWTSSWWPKNATSRWTLSGSAAPTNDGCQWASADATNRCWSQSHITSSRSFSWDLTKDAASTS